MLWLWGRRSNPPPTKLHLYSSLSLRVTGRSGRDNGVELCIRVHEGGMNGLWSGVCRRKMCIYKMRRGVGSCSGEENEKQCLKLCKKLMQLYREGWRWNWHGVHKGTWLSRSKDIQLSAVASCFKFHSSPNSIFFTGFTRFIAACLWTKQIVRLLCVVQNLIS